MAPISQMMHMLPVPWVEPEDVSNAILSLVAREAGLKPQLVHYYFRTMDDLFLAMSRTRAATGMEREATPLASPQPLRALWEYSTDPAGTALTMEFSGLANHRKAIKAEIARYAERFRAEQTKALAVLADRY